MKRAMKSGHLAPITRLPKKAQSTTELKTEFALDMLALGLDKFPRGGAGGGGGGGGGAGGVGGFGN